MASQAQIKKWTLSECVAYALENNITIKQSVLDLKETTINKKDAVGNFFPSFNAGASHSWNLGLNVDPVTNINVNTTTQTTSGGINSSVDIYRYILICRYFILLSTYCSMQ